MSGARTGVHTLQSEYLTNEKMELTGEAHLRFSGPFSFLLLSGPFSQLALAPYFYSINTDHRFTIFKIAKVTRISLLFPIFSIHHFYLFNLLYYIATKQGQEIFIFSAACTRIAQTENCAVIFLITICVHFFLTI